MRNAKREQVRNDYITDTLRALRYAKEASPLTGNRKLFLHSAFLFAHMALGLTDDREDIAAPLRVVCDNVKLAAGVCEWPIPTKDIEFWRRTTA